MMGVLRVKPRAGVPTGRPGGPGPLRRCLARRWVAVVAAILGMALVLPSLRSGWQVDDCFYQVVLTGNPVLSDVSPPWWDLYNNLGGVDRNRRMMDLGMLPWWTLETVRLAWWRPIAALSLWIDFRLWPDTPSLMHLHSIIWYGAVVAVAAVFYRRLIPVGWAAGLAGLLYAVDDAHGLPAGWLSNRNALLGAFFALLALMAHDTWRRRGWRPAALLAPIALGLALLSAEASVAAGAYIVSYALCLDRGGARLRMLSLLPCATVIVLWQLTYHQLGYGMQGTAPWYINPLVEPARFAPALLQNGPLLLLMEWAPPIVPLLGWAPGRVPGWPASLAALLLLGLLGWGLAELLRRDRLARFWALGQALAAISASAALPDRRQLLFVGLGTMGLLAQFVAGLIDRKGWAPRGRLGWIGASTLAISLVFLHAVLAPLELPSASRGPVGSDELLRRATDSIPTTPEIEGQDVVLVDAPDAAVPGYVLAYRAVQRLPVPKTLRSLVTGTRGAELYRQDSHTLIVRPIDGYLREPLDRIFRGEGYPMQRGQRVDLPGLNAEVTALTPDGRPGEAAFRFAGTLEQPSLRWLVWSRKSGTYVPFVPPPIGETVSVR
jgi:hypothetical protein